MSYRRPHPLDHRTLAEFWPRAAFWLAVIFSTAVLS